MRSYGKELLLDLHNSDVSTFNRKSIKQYLIELCDLIKMVREDLHWWDYQDIPKEDWPMDSPHLLGTSCVQFISTSNIVIHTKDLLGTININIFSCKDFDPIVARRFSEDWFKGKTVNNNGKGFFITRY